MKRLYIITGIIASLFPIIAHGQTFEESGRPLSLREAQQLVIQRHPSVRNVEEQLIQSDAMIRSAWAMLLPNVSASAQLIRNQNAVEMMFPDMSAFPQTEPTDPGTTLPMNTITIQEKWQANMGMSANITLFNARSIPLIRMAYRMVDRTTLEAQIARNDLLFAVTSAFYQMGTMRQLIDVHQENLSVAQEFLKMSQARLDVGQTTKIDVMRARMQVKESEKAHSDAIDAYHTVKRSTAVFLGIDANYVPIIDTDTTPDAPPVDDLIERAMKNRVEMEKARLDIDIAQRRGSEVKAQWLPVLDVTGKVDTSNAEGFTGDKTNWTLIFGARWSLLEGGGRLAELKKRRSEIRVAQNNLQLLKMSIENDVAEKHQTVTTANRNVAVTTDMVTLAEENHAMIAAQYQVGVATSLDVFNAARELSAQKVMLELDKLKYIMAFLELEKTIGEYNSLAATS